jgi:purine-binding chemotaxis protein CheW
MTANYYSILEIEPGADQESIEAAYRRLALLYHPDLNRSSEATRRMQEVNAAYMTLRNPSKRAVYDREHGIHSGYIASRVAYAPPVREAYRPYVTYNPPQPSPNISTQPEPSGETQLLTFYIENSIYAFDILDVESVNMMQPILQHLRAPAFVEGLVMYRGLRLPVIDLHRHLGLSNQLTTRDTRILVVKFNGISTGLIVDSTGAVLKIENNTIEAPHSLADETNSHFVKGIVHSGFQTVVILDLPALLTSEEYEALKNFVG